VVGILGVDEDESRPAKRRLACLHALPATCRGLRDIAFQSKAELVVFYKEQQLATRYRTDLLAFGAIVTELKAVAELISDHEAQLFNYLRIARQPVGYLINVGRKGNLEWQRLILSDLQYQLPQELSTEGVGVAAESPVMPFVVDAQSHDFPMPGQSMDLQGGGRMCQFDDRLEVSPVGGSTRFVSYSGVTPPG